MSSSETLIVFDLDDTLINTSELLLPLKHIDEISLRLESPIPLMPGAYEVLVHLTNNSRFDLLLLSQGLEKLQLKKVHQAGLKNFFREVLIVENGLKPKAFQDLALGYSARKVSIGNRLSTDLSPAIAAGFEGVWFQHGEHLLEESLLDSRAVEWRVRNHFELMALLKSPAFNRY